MRSRGAVLALVLSLTSVLAACGSRPAAPQGADTGTGIRLVGVDGNMVNAFSDEFKNPQIITGMVGTTPMTPLSDEFKHRLLAINPKITGWNYAGEMYDAVTITALAAELARTTDPTVMSRYVVGITTASPGDVQCESPATCLSAIRSGRDIVYRGIAVRSGFTDAGEPSSASYGTLHFGRDYKIDDGKTEYVIAGEESKASTNPPPSPAPDSHSAKGAPLKLGVLLPRTGGLAFQGPPMFAAAELAIADVNAAGGVLGKKVESIELDDGTSPDKSVAAVAQFAAQGVQAIIGPSTSGSALAVIPKAVDAGMMVVSGSATSDKLTAFPDHGMFFRTAPPDNYQAHAVSDVIMRAGALKVFVVARDDAYGKGLSDTVVADLAAAGIKKIHLKAVTYTDKQTDFSAIADQVKAFAPDTVLVVGYVESAKVIEAINGENKIEMTP